MSGFEPELPLPGSWFCSAITPMSISSNTARRSFSYERLPPQQLRLSILKLDGSYFDVQVARTATVAELKDAVEEVFSQLPKEREIKISWSHVWGNFVLCYKGYKLNDDKAHIRLFGVRDGDQLHFVKHMK